MKALPEAPGTRHLQLGQGQRKVLESPALEMCQTSASIQSLISCVLDESL